MCFLSLDLEWVWCGVSLLSVLSCLVLSCSVLSCHVICLYVCMSRDVTLLFIVRFLDVGWGSGLGLFLQESACLSLSLSVCRACGAVRCGAWTWDMESNVG